MRINVKMLLGASLASMISACVVPQDTNASDSENPDDSMAAQAQAPTVSTPSLGENAAAATAHSCNTDGEINIDSYGKAHGVAECAYGYTMVPNYANQRHKFIVGTDLAVYHTWQNLTTKVGSAWERDGGLATSSVFAGTISGGGLQLCVVGSDFVHVYVKKYFPSTGWGNWTNIGTSTDLCHWEDGPNWF